MNGDHFSQKVERAFVEIVIEKAERKGFKKGFAVDFHTTQGVQYREASIGIDCGCSAHGSSNRKRVKLLVGDCGRAGQRTEVNMLTKGVGS